MNATSSTQLVQQPTQSYPHYKELNSFELSLEIALSAGMFDESITVCDSSGNYPIVAALAKEQMYYLTERVKACGGYANIFVLDVDLVTVLHSTRTEMITEGAEDFTDLQNGGSTIGAFIDYLRLRPNGVCIPSTLRKGEESRLSIGKQTFDTKKMPNVQMA